MGVYSLNMLAIALELAQKDPVYEDIASKFFEHFLYIAERDERASAEDRGLWDDEDGFYYDVLRGHDGEPMPMKVRSVVGLMPLLAVETIERDTLDAVPAFCQAHGVVHRQPPRPRQERRLHCSRPEPSRGGCSRSSDRDRLRRILQRMLDEEEFFSPHGIRSLSKFHREHPYAFNLDGSDLPRRLRAGGVDRADCSAATRTGAARSGSRSTTC